MKNLHLNKYKYVNNSELINFGFKMIDKKCIKC